MSMLSAQCDELRAMAESVGLAMPQAATLMMEAADTIWKLRDSVHRERAEADRLRELATGLHKCWVNEGCEDCPMQDDDGWCVRDIRLRELGMEVDE